MSNTNNNLQTQTSNALHNAIIEAGGKDRPPMLAPGNYVQWKSKIKRYIDTKPNNELIHYCLQNPPYKFKWTEKTVPVAEGINNDIYSTVDACPNACEMSKAIERLKQGESINVQDLEINLYWEFENSHHEMQHQNEVNELRAERLARTANPLALVAQQQPVYHPTTTLTIPQPDHNKLLPETKEKIDKLMALISLSFKKIYKPTNKTSKCTQVVQQSRIQEKMLLYKQEEAGFQLNDEQADGCDDTNDEPKDQELEAHYLYMAQIQEVTLDTADNFGPIFDAEPLQKVQNNDDNYNVFAIETEHLEQPKSVNDTYLVEQDEHNIINDSLDMSYDREQDDQDDDDFDKERDLLASIIEKQKCKIDDSKNHNKFLESSNKALVDKLKGVIPTTSVSIPQLKSNQLEDRFMPNNSQGKKQEVEDHRRNFKFSNNKTYVTACNDSLNAKTSNVNFVCVTYGKCVLNDNHDMYVLHYINGVNSRTKMPMAVPISTREPKRTVNQSTATPLKRTVASESTNQKP
ncbi:hypothetical protein Tco_1010942, partial [Tanacetum coccineum]